MRKLTFRRAITARALGTAGIAIASLAVFPSSPAQAKMLCGGIDGYLIGGDVALVIPDPETGGFGNIVRTSRADAISGPFTLGSGAFRFWDNRGGPYRPTTLSRVVLHPGDTLFVRWTAHDSCSVRLNQSQAGEIDLGFDGPSMDRTSAHHESHMIITEREQSDAR